MEKQSATIAKVQRVVRDADCAGQRLPMEVQTPKATRRSTRIRVEISASVTSLDRMRPFAEQCMVLIVSAQGCGFRSSQALQLETPIMLTGLPGGASVTARVANCLPLGNDGKSFLIGAALYTHGNVWQIADPRKIGVMPPAAVLRRVQRTLLLAVHN